MSTLDTRTCDLRNLLAFESMSISSVFLSRTITVIASRTKEELHPGGEHGEADFGSHLEVEGLDWLSSLRSNKTV